MKRIWLVICCVFLAALFGCGGKTPEAASSAAQSSAPTFKTADELIAEAEARSRAESVSSQAMVYGDLKGTYVFQSPDLKEEYRPTLTLNLDGTAFFRPNLYAGMGELYATYVIEGDSVHLTVTSLNFEGFTGDNVTELVLDLLPDGSLELAYTVPDTEIGVTRAGDRFILK